MPESTLNSETRDDVLHVPNLYEFFCQRTSEDFLRRGGGDEDQPAVSFAGIIVSFMVAVTLFTLGNARIAKAMFAVFGLFVLWTVWGVVIRSSSRSAQKAEDIRAGNFPPESANFVVARLKWWNHLVMPMRWAKHSRIFDRRTKLERKIDDVARKIAELTANAQQAYSPPTPEEAAELAATTGTMAVRKDYELRLNTIDNQVDRLRAELLLYQALLHKLNEVADKLERIEGLTVVFQNFSAGDLTQVVSEALQVLEERRILVLAVDKIDPDSFIDLVTVRAE